jgi:hypothetical protein
MRFSCYRYGGDRTIADFVRESLTPIEATQVTDAGVVVRTVAMRDEPWQVQALGNRRDVPYGLTLADAGNAFAGY